MKNNTPTNVYYILNYVEVSWYDQRKHRICTWFKGHAPRSPMTVFPDKRRKDPDLTTKLAIRERVYLQVWWWLWLTPVPNNTPPNVYYNVRVCRDRI